MTNDYFTAEDLTQETFLSAFRHFESFNGENEKAWICKIAVHKCLDYQKRKDSKLIPAEYPLLEQTLTKEGQPENEYIEKELFLQLEEHCKSLKPPYNEIALLYYVKEKKAEEISFLTGKKLKTVQTQIYRAREMLRKIYGKEYGT